MSKSSYEFDNDLGMKKEPKGFWNVLWKSVKWLVASLSLSLFCYFILSLFISTDSEKKIRRENRMYEKMYNQMLDREELLEGAIEDLQNRDDKIYMEVFNTEAPSVNPGDALNFVSDTLLDGNVIKSTAARVDKTVATADRVEANFMKVFELLTDKDFIMPPLKAPIKDMSYTQIGASVGEKQSPFTKVVAKHDGIDLIAGQGQPVYVPADGVVIDLIHSGKGLGNVLEIAHDNGITTCYAHLADMKVRNGQRVKAGQVIGSVGISGNSFAPHLHYEVRRFGVPQDPVNYMFATFPPDVYPAAVYMSVSTEQSMD